MITYTVYRHITPSGKSYIGITSKSVEKRKRWGYRKNPYMTAAVKKYGWTNIETEILAEDVTLDEANLLETYYIASFETQDRKHGYNICDGGMYFNSRLETIREHIAQAARNRVRTEDERLKSCIHSPTRKAVLCVENGVIYPSLNFAAKALHGQRNCIRLVANGEWKQYRGLHFQWVERCEDG